MDQQLANLYNELLVESKSILLIENKNWPGYIRGQFAQLRKVVKAIDQRVKEIDEVTNQLLNR